MQSKAYKNLLKGAGSLVDIFPSRPSEGYRKGLFLQKKPSAARTIQDCWKEIGDTIRVAASEAISEETSLKSGAAKTVVRLAPKEDTGEWTRIGKPGGIITRKKMREIVTQAIEERIIEKE